MKKVASVMLIISMCLIGITSIWGNNNFSYASTKGSVDNINERNYQAIKSQIDILKQDHPNWQFEILYTGLDWNTVIQNERNKNVVYDYYSGTQWTTNTANEPGWINASDLATSYLMDSRYFLNENNVFQFLDISYSGYDMQQITNMVKGTFLNNTSYINALISYGQSYNVSPYFLVAKILQEQGANPTSPAATGAKFTYDTEVYEGLYNLFNIAATGNTSNEIIRNELRYAQNKGWTSIEKSIEGGAKFLRDNYVSKGQISTYLQKFDVDDSDGKLYVNQYMTNLFGAQAEGWKLKNTYKQFGFDSSFKFVIPVYENMPTLTSNIDLVNVNVANTLSLKSDANINSTKVYYANNGNTVTRINKAKQANSSDGYYWDLVLLNNGMIGYMARGDSSKEYLVSYKTMSIDPTENVNISQAYNSEENTVMIYASAEKGFTANKDSSWTLSSDGKTYSKKYSENTDYNTTFTFADGYTRSVNIKITSIDYNKVGISRTYLEDTNLIVVNAYNKQGFKADKDWTLSEDGKTYSKVFLDNTDYYTTFTLNNGVQASTRILVTQINQNKARITNQYNDEKNTETVSVYYPQGFTANKDVSWSLSNDGKVYSKEYTDNTNYQTSFTFKDGNTQTAKIIVEKVDLNKVGITKKYNSETNVMTVYAYNPTGFMAGKDWTLSEDAKTYSREFIQNINYTTIFTLRNGTNALTKIEFSDIDENRTTLTKSYDSSKNITTVSVYCPQGFVANKDVSWKLSQDGRTYSKEFSANTNYYTTFTLNNGTKKQENVVVTDIQDMNIDIKQDFNNNNNTATVTVYNSQGFKATKDSSWKLSEDSKTYSKVFTENKTENETFTFKNGVEKQVSINVNSIIDNKLVITQSYDASKNVAIVNVSNSQGFVANKDASWKLSQDGKTYSKEYAANTNYYTTFTLNNGGKLQANVVVTSIVDTNIAISQEYSKEKNSVSVNVYSSNGFTANKDSSWKLSQDEKTYSKEFTQNVNVSEKFTLKTGFEKELNIIVSSIVDNKLVITQSYDSSKNIATVNVSNGQGFVANKDASWKLSQDGKTYSKEYGANTNYYTTFTLNNGEKLQANVVVTSIIDTNIELSQEYNSEKNSVSVNVYSVNGFTANKDSSWKLSQDEKTYTKEYTQNLNVTEKFTLKTGFEKQLNIVVNSIVDNELKVTQSYDDNKNIATVHVYNTQGFTANKDVSWKLSSDGKTYSKDFEANTNYNTTFTLKNGTKQQVNIVVTSIDPNKISISNVYDEEENSVTVNVYNANGFTVNKDTSWNISEDGKTYSKKYTENTNYNTTFTFKDGSKKVVNIIATEIDPNKIGIIQVYDEATKVVEVSAYSVNGFTSNKDVSWKISEDGKTYTKKYTANTDYSTTFTLKDGTKISRTIKITSIK